MLKSDLYINNLLSGTNTIDEAIKIRDETIQLLKLAGFNLRQWGSNNPRILCLLDEDNIAPDFHFDKDHTLKTLSIVWNAKDNCIIYTTKPIKIELA